MKLDQLVKDMQRTVIFGLLLSALWLASSATYIRTLQRKHDLPYLLAYLLIKDAMIPRIQGQTRIEDMDFPSEVRRNCPDPGSPECKPSGIPIDIPWDPARAEAPYVNIVPIRPGNGGMSRSLLNGRERRLG